MKATIKYFLVILLLSAFAGLAGECQTKMMSFNIRYDNPNDKENWWENRKNELVQLIDYYHPEFLGIQEGLNHQVEFINNKLQLFDYIGVGREDGKEKGEYTAIFYDTLKYKLIESKVYWLSETPDKVSIGWDSSLERITTFGTFRNIENKDTIYIFNTHFDHIGETARKMSSKFIVSKIGELGLDEQKVIVMGDFNSEPKGLPIKILKGLLDDSIEMTQKSSYGPKGTFNGFDKDRIPKERIDYIFTKNIDVLSYRHIDDRRKNGLCISDHLPVIIEIKTAISNK